MRGLDDVERRQWRVVWPRTRGFRFRSEEGSIVVSADRRLAVVMTPWASIGLAGEGGATFERSGRATILLQRDATDAPWLGIHTHFSLMPDPDAEAPGG